jgi:DNA invertase Pin-like site-specific DNA recombinase
MLPPMVPSSVAHAASSSSNALLAQKAAIRRWASGRRVRVGAWYEELCDGEGPLWKARPVLMDALSTMRAGEGGVLVIASRRLLDVVEEGIVEALARRQGGTVVASDGTEARPAALRMVGAFDLYEGALRSVRARAERRRREADGAPPFGEVPYGYRRNASGTRVVRDAAEQRVLALVAHMRADGFILREIVAELWRLGLRSRRGHRIGITRVFEMLRDIENEHLYEPLRRALQGAPRGAG